MCVEKKKSRVHITSAIHYIHFLFHSLSLTLDLRAVICDRKGERKIKHIKLNVNNNKLRARPNCAGDAVKHLNIFDS